MEALSRLCQVDINEDALCGQLDDGIYEHLVRLLTVHDIQLIVTALETLYQLSELGHVTSSHIAGVTASIGTSEWFQHFCRSRFFKIFFIRLLPTSLKLCGLP